MGVIKTVQNNKNVLIIDDNEDFLDILKEYFKHIEHIYNIYTVSSCDEAVKILKDNDINLAFIDINLQVMSGLECLHVLREVNPELPAYLMSGYIIDNESDDFKNLNILGILEKPFTLLEFLSIVVDYFSSGGEK